MSDALLDYDEAIDKFDPVLGLEVHVELNTATKMFCSCTNQFGGEPNTHVCPVCLGLPGALPVINEKAVESAIRIGLALNCSIAPWCRMARKNYFYPDMTKDFQTSQYDEPIAFDGFVDLEVGEQVYRVGVERAHMEEDAGKSLHVGSTGRIQGADYSLMDYNRAGTPLIEIVTKIISGTGNQAPQVASAYVAYLRDMMRALKVSDVKMEQGSLRCDANVSLSPKGSGILGTRTETKNINSLRSIEAALIYEIRRQAAVLDSGNRVKQETRMWHEQGFTTAGRSKEEAEDYRYFPEPDLVPIAVSSDRVAALQASIPEPPALKRKKFQIQYGFSDLEMRDIIAAEALDLIEQTVTAGASAATAKKWWLGELLRQANLSNTGLADLEVQPTQVAQVQTFIESGAINDKLAREVFEAILAGQSDIEAIIAERGLAVVSDDNALLSAVDHVIAANPVVAAKIQSGKVQAVGALIGQVMREFGGKADAARVRDLIMQRLG